jgi:hypothetical protein
VADEQEAQAGDEDSDRSRGQDEQRVGANAMPAMRAGSRGSGRIFKMRGREMHSFGGPGIAAVIQFLCHA